MPCLHILVSKGDKLKKIIFSYTQTAMVAIAAALLFSIALSFDFIQGAVVAGLLFIAYRSGRAAGWADGFAEGQSMKFPGVEVMPKLKE